MGIFLFISSCLKKSYLQKVLRDWTSNVYKELTIRLGKPAFGLLRVIIFSVNYSHSSLLHGSEQAHPEWSVVSGVEIRKSTLGTHSIRPKASSQTSKPFLFNETDQAGDSIAVII